MCPSQEVYGPWRLYGDKIRKKLKELSSRPPKDDVHSELYRRVLQVGLFYGGWGFSMDKVFRQAVDMDSPDEVAAFENVLYLADQLFQSQDLTHS